MTSRNYDLSPSDRKQLGTRLALVQFLTSPLSTHPHIGAEPGRAKRRVQDNLHAHAQNAAIFSPQIGGKTIFGSASRFGLLRDF